METDITDMWKDLESKMGQGMLNVIETSNNFFKCIKVIKHLNKPFYDT